MINKCVRYLEKIIKQVDKFSFFWMYISFVISATCYLRGSCENIQIKAKHQQFAHSLKDRKKNDVSDM